MGQTAWQGEPSQEQSNLIVPGCFFSGTPCPALIVALPVYPLFCVLSHYKKCAWKKRRQEKEVVPNRKVKKPLFWVVKAKLIAQTCQSVCFMLCHCPLWTELKVSVWLASFQQITSKNCKVTDPILSVFIQKYGHLCLSLALPWDMREEPVVPSRSRSENDFLPGLSLGWPDICSASVPGQRFWGLRCSCSEVCPC